MASTMQWLEEYEGGRLAMSLVFDGYNLVCCTLTPQANAPDDIDLLKAEFLLDTALWSEFTQFQGGLMAVGDIGQSIKFLDPQLEPGAITFDIVDHGDILTGSMLREGNSSGFKTYLTASVAAGSTAAINVKSTTGFAASGTIYIGHEQIEYSGKTATTFTGITRAVNGFLATDAGGSGAGGPYAPAHGLQENTTAGPATAPSVTSYPRTWYGRFVTLLLHVYDPVTGRWSKPTDSRQLWAGRIEDYGDNGDGTVYINCKNAIDLLSRPVTGAQWQARFGGGMTFNGSYDDTIVLRNSATTAYFLQATLPVPDYDLQYEHDDVARIVSEKLAAWATAGSLHPGDSLTLDLIPSTNDAPPQYQFTFTCSTAVTGDNTVKLGLDKRVWRILGFGATGDEGAEPATLPGNQFALYRTFTPTTSAGTRHVLRATLPPIVYFSVPLTSFQVAANNFIPDDAVGTMLEQDPDDIGALSTSNVVLAMGGNIFSAYYDSGTGSVTWHLQFDPTAPQKYGMTAGWRPIQESLSQEYALGAVRLGDASDAPLMRQVWYERGGKAGDRLLRLLLSSGTPGYNHATYDYYEGEGFGLGIPASMVDIESFQELNYIQSRISLNEPRPFYSIAEQVLAVSGRHIVWKSRSATEQPKLTVVKPSTDTDYRSLWVLDEANKAGAGPGNPDRTTVRRVTDGLYNRFVLKHQPKFGVTSIEQTITVENIPSQSDYGRRQTMTSKTSDVIDAEDVFVSTISPAIAYFGRPLALATRSINASLMRMAPGDSVSFSDNNVANPLTGVRGETMYGWVQSTSFNLDAGRGSCQIVFLPEKNPGRTRPWAPSCRVDETAANAGYDAGTKKLTVKAQEFGPFLNGIWDLLGVDQENDVERFSVGDQVHIYALDDGAAPLEWFDEVAAVNTTGPDTMTLVSGLGGWDAAKLYVVEYRNINDVINQQRNMAFLADEDFSTTYSDPDPYDWGTDGAVGLTDTTEVSTTGMFEPHPGAIVEGEPASVHKVAYLVQGLNSLLVKTGPVYLNECWPESDACAYPYGAVTGYTGTYTYLAYIPIYGYVGGVTGARPLLVRVRYRADTGSELTVEVQSSRTPPPAVGPLVANRVEVVAASTATTAAWSNEFELTPLATFDSTTGLAGTWVFITMSVQDVGNPTPTGWITGITVREKAPV